MTTSAEQNHLWYLPFAYAQVDESMTLFAASRELGPTLGARLRGRSIEDNLTLLAQAWTRNTALCNRVMESVAHLPHEGGTDAWDWTEGDHVFAVSVTALPPNEKTGGKRWGIGFRDIGRQMELDREREMARLYIEETLNSLPLGVTVMDEHLRVTSVNRTDLAAMETAGREAALLTAIGEPAAHLFPAPTDQPDLWTRVENEVLRKGVSLEHKTLWNVRNGAARTQAVRIAPLRNADGRIVGAVRIAEDVTDKERMEKDLQAAELVSARFSAVREVVATLNHEINNDLTAVLGNAEMLKIADQDLPAATRDKMLSEIVVHAEKIAEVTLRLRSLKTLRNAPYLNDEKYGRETLIDWRDT
jgi:PAS domain-containing protein